MRISIKTYRKNEDLKAEEAWVEFVNHLVMDSVCPALCSEYCEVEPDGTCEHGCPSILLALGLI